MGTVTTISRQYFDGEPNVQCHIDNEGRKYRDVFKTICCHQDFYVNTDHIVSLEPVVKNDTKCTQVTLSTGEKFITLYNIETCLQLR